MLGKSDYTTTILQCHRELNIGGDPSNRISFHKTLERLLFGEKTEVEFSDFISTFDRALNEIKATSSSVSDVEKFRIAFTQVLDDLHGIFHSTVFNKSYNFVFY